MKLYSIETGNFKLDGGAMFGVVPRVLWEKTNPADENNQIDMAMRCLLIETDDKLILIDTGLGNKQSDKFFSYYNLYGDDTLEKSLKKNGFSKEDITDVFITHLHFDHVGGAVEWNSNKTKLQPTFPNAKYWSNADHWKWATKPNPREKASFLKENILPIEESGQLHFIDFKGEKKLKNTELGFDILRVDGHTDGQMLAKINYKNKTLVYMADFLPTSAHVPLPYIMGYDTRPLITITEKEEFLKEAAENNYYLFLEHDAYHSVCTVKNTEKGVRLDETLQLEDIFDI
jgi:glyoxylase-like metal-dependent hydrolase (beta-lactamase superfamily II)